VTDEESPLLLYDFNYHLVDIT